MKAIEWADNITLPDQRVAVCGDWHGNSGWARVIAGALPLLAPDVSTILHLGDWWMKPDLVDEIFGDTGIDRIYVTLGNHEQWDQASRVLGTHPGSAVRVSEICWLLPRPARFTIGGRLVLSLGGASSVDRESRQEGLTWWPDEAITDDHVTAAIAGGPADLMLTHESPAGSPVRGVQEVLRTNPHWFSKTALAASAASRARVGEVWDAVRPELLAHGHMHVPGGGATEDGRRVASLGRDVQEGNLGILDMRTLKMTTPSLRTIRGAAEHGTAGENWMTRGRTGQASAPEDIPKRVDGRRTIDELVDDVLRRPRTEEQ